MPSRPKVLVAMSGGVDSSVAAAMLLREGHEVVGCFMRLGSPGETLDEIMPYSDVVCDMDPGRSAGPPGKVKIGHQGCCSINDAADARLVAAELGIPFYVCNFKKDFGRIIDYFVDEYSHGRTPNPCVRCNDWLKFGKLHEYARQIGADYVASGHYARVDRGGPQAIVPSSHRGEGDYRLLRGVDHSKDQSYVLFGVPRAQLAQMLLPVGWYEKPRIREFAKEWGLPVFDKPDSQEICFVPDNDYAGLIERRAPSSIRAGPIVDSTGNLVGSHTGQHRFTVGQRRGLSVSLGYPVYVVGKDAQTNTVVVGPREELACSGCTVEEANWLVGDEWRCGGLRRVLARIRYGAAPVDAEVLPGPDTPRETPSGRRGTFEVRFIAPQDAVTPGQALVLYDASEPDVVIGGGWIAKITS